MVGCAKDEPELNPYFVKNYQKLLDSLTFKCDTVSADNYIKADINGHQVCYYDGYDDMSLSFGFSNKFTTPSPSTGGEVSNARRGCRLSISPRKKKFCKHYISIDFPDFNLDMDPVIYFDSILSIKEHGITGTTDILIDPKAGFVSREMDKASGGFLRKCKITFNMPTDTIGNLFLMSTVFGDQTGSYLKIIHANKTRKPDGIYYDLIFEFRCKLYHWPQYGKKGLWGAIDNGVFVGTVIAK